LETNEMPVLANAKYERMAQLLARGLAAVDAHEQAGYRRNDSNASTWANKPLIKQRVEEIKADAARLTTRKLHIDKDYLVSEAERIQRLAEAGGNYQAAMNALKEQGVLTGIRIERQEVGQPGEFQAIEAMSRAELVAFIQDSIEAGELMWPDTKALPNPDSDQPVALLTDNKRASVAPKVLGPDTVGCQQAAQGQTRLARRARRAGDG
jgi:hypothetical protein